MKKLEMNQMESLNGQGWGFVACRVGFILVGAAIGGPGGTIAGGIAGGLLCGAHEAH
jgi:hypothetical protein